MKPGDILDGRYTITERLGAGGMGEVYKATHTFLGSSRVIKVVHPHISGNTDAHDRFLREARAATKVQHPNVATLHDFAALPDGAHYMVWEFIDGENLAQRLRARAARCRPARPCASRIQALRGLEAIHRAGIIHRDISPENLMITARRRGEDHRPRRGQSRRHRTRSRDAHRHLRRQAPLRLAGTTRLPARGREDRRAAPTSTRMAMVLFELLTGRPPYEATSPHEYFMLHAVEPRKQTVALPIGDARQRGVAGRARESALPRPQSALTPTRANSRSLSKTSSGSCPSHGTCPPWPCPSTTHDAPVIPTLSLNHRRSWPPSNTPRTFPVPAIIAAQGDEAPSASSSSSPPPSATRTPGPPTSATPAGSSPGARTRPRPQADQALPRRRLRRGAWRRRTPAPSVKQHLAAIRMLFDWLVTGQVVAVNPAHAVRGPKHVVKKGKTPVLDAEDEPATLLDSIDTSTTSSACATGR